MTWQNWARNQVCEPVAVEHPSTDAELASVVKRAAADGRTVKTVGAGHSFTDIACTNGVQIQLDRYRQVLRVDKERKQVTVQAGITIEELNAELHANGLAMPNMGDIAYQSISGAVSTATHGTGIAYGGIATQLVGLDVVSGDGSIVSCTTDEEPEVFSCARVGLGALGVLSTLTLQCVDAFNLKAVEMPMRIDDVMANLDDHVEGNDHFEFYVVPHTGWALTKRNNRTDEPVGGMPRWKEYRDKVVIENWVFGAACRVGRRKPAWIPKVMKILPSAAGRVEYVKPGHLTFVSPRLVHFYEMEYSIPRAACAEAIARVREWIDGSGLQISFPIEVRFTAADEIPLSTANGSERCYIAVHMYWGSPYEQYFRSVEAIMDSLGGRPHWGKMHYQTATTLKPRYADWDRFQSVRRRLDPEGRFANAYTDRVLGPV